MDTFVLTPFPETFCRVSISNVVQFANTSELIRRTFPPRLAVRESSVCFASCGTKAPVLSPLTPVLISTQIARMYKRMAEAGYLAKEPGMGAADIAKAHERSALAFHHAQR